ncbi:MAG: hypothetical protein NTV93_18660 [Verrucomicrobia bacterium]|nr:hypothetical protein [Verrucomicrobiota bacterium]
MKILLLIAALTLGTALADPQQIIQIQPAPLPGMQPTVLIDNRPAPGVIAQQIIQIQPAPLPGMQPTVLIDNRPAPNVIVITPLATPAPMVVKPMGPIQPVRPMGTGFGQPPSQWDRRWP